MHRLIIGPRRAATACGIRIVCYYPNTSTGLPTGETAIVNCSTDPEIKPTCEGCYISPTADQKIREGAEASVVKAWNTRSFQPATPTGCICQDQHRRGYCTEPGCSLATGGDAVAGEAKRIRLALIAGGVTSPDGTFVHASISEVVAALRSPDGAATTPEPVAFINSRLADLAEANALYGNGQHLNALYKIARNEREISWLEELQSTILTAAKAQGPKCYCHVLPNGYGKCPECRTTTWKEVAQKAGVCMTCALGAPDTFGCTDCLNTGWNGGSPAGFVRASDAAQGALEPNETALNCARFVRWALQEGPWQGDDLDGSEVQEKAESLGLIVSVPYDPEKHGADNNYGCDAGESWFEFSAGLNAVRASPITSTESERGATDTFVHASTPDVLKVAVISSTEDKSHD